MQYWKRRFASGMQLHEFCSAQSTGELVLSAFISYYFDVDKAVCTAIVVLLHALVMTSVVLRRVRNCLSIIIIIIIHLPEIVWLDENYK